MPFLRQSTSQVIRFGPALDITDGVTEETALTLAQADMRLSKDGGAFAQKNAAGNATHDSDGWYSTTLNATDTNTVGELILNVHQPANMLPVWMRFWVLEEAIYDALFGAAAAGFNASGLVTLAGVTHTGAVIPTVTTNTDMRGTDNAALASVLGALNDAAAAGDPTVADTVVQYLKQIINTLEGAAGIPVFPAAADPANAVSLAESIRAIRDDVTGLAGAAMRGTDGVDTAAMRGTDGANTTTPPTTTQIRDAIMPTQNVAFNNIEFLFVHSTDHVTPVTGATGGAVTRSIDGGAFAAATGTLAEVGNGIYQFDASAADMNGGVITFRFTATGGTPGAPDDVFLTIVTGGGV